MFVCVTRLPVFSEQLYCSAMVKRKISAFNPEMHAVTHII